MFGSNGAVAPLPAVGYPASSFFGATSLFPNKVASDSSGPASMGNVIPVNKTQVLIAIGAIVLIGYGLWHWNMR